MENQRCRTTLQPNGQAGEAAQSPVASQSSSLLSITQAEELFDLIASSQSRRLDDQRATIRNCLAFRIAQHNVGHLCEACNPREPSDDFFNMLIKYQSSRLNDQRCSLPEPLLTPDPDEDFFSLIQRVQAKRMDEQRVSFYPPEQDETDSEPSSKPSGDAS